MKAKFLSLILAITLSLAISAPAALANTYTKDDIISLYNALSDYIGENIDAIQENISSEADGFCGYAIELATYLANSGDQNDDIAYELMYSVYSYILLIVNNDSTKDGVADLYARIADDFITDEYFDVIDTQADEENVKSLVREKKYNELYEILCDVVYKYIEYIAGEAEEFFLQNIETTAMQTETHSFEDVATDDWFYGAVSYVHTMGLFKGTSETRFSPQLTMTRGMFITVLERFAAGRSFESTKPHGFADVSDDAYYKPAITWAKEEGIIDWASGDKFYPDQPITREEMVVSMFLFAKKIGGVGAFESIIQSVADGDQISAWAVQGMDWAYGTGVIKGYTDGSVRPKGSATRAEVAQVFLNYFAVISITNNNI